MLFCWFITAYLKVIPISKIVVIVLCIYFVHVLIIMCEVMIVLILAIWITISLVSCIIKFVVSLSIIVCWSVRFIVYFILWIAISPYLIYWYIIITPSSYPPLTWSTLTVTDLFITPPYTVSSYSITHFITLLLIY